MRNDRTPTRFIALGALLAVGCSERPKPAPAAPPPPPPPSAYAYVTNEDSHDLTIINADNDSAIGTIPVGTRPRGVKVSQDGKLVFVALSGSPKCPPTMPDEECEKLTSDKSKDGVAVVDAATRTVSRVLPGGSDPETFALSRRRLENLCVERGRRHGIHRRGRDRKDPRHRADG